LVAIVLLVVCALGLTEVTGVTKVSEFVATVLRIRTPQGTLVVEVEDPEVTVDVEGDGETITLSGLGPHEIRLRPGTHQLRKTKDGVPMGTEWVTVTRGGKQVVKVELEQEARQPLATWLSTVRRFSGHTDAVRSLAISSDGRLVLSGCGDGTMCLWDAATGERIRVFPGHTIAKPLDVAIGPNGRKAASSDWTGIIRLWNLETGEKLAEFQSRHGGIYQVEFSADGNTLLSTGCDKTARIWRVQTGDQVQVLEGHRNWVSDGAFSPDGRIVVTASFDGTVRLWDASSSKQIRQLEHPKGVMCVAFSPDGRLVASGCHDGIVRVFEAHSGNQVQRCVGHTDRIQDVQFSADGRWVISGSYDRTLRIWDLQSGRELVRHEAIHHIFNALAMFPDGRHILSAGGTFKEKDTDKWICEFDYDIRTWRLPDTSAEGALPVPEILNEVRRFEGHIRWITGLSFLDGGNKAISVSNDTTLRIWDVHTGEELRRIDTGELISSLALSPDEKLAAAGIWTSSGFHLWSLESGEKVQTFEGLEGARVGYLAFSPDGRRIVSSSHHKITRLWDLETGEETRRFQTTGHPMGATYSPDGRFIVTQDPDKNILVSEAESGETVHVLRTRDTGETLRTAFSPDGRQLVTGSQIGAVRLWDLSTGKEIGRFSGHSRAVVAVVFTPDGRHIISGSIERSLRVWEIASGREVARIQSDTRRFLYLAVSPDGRHLITGGGAGWIAHRQTWELDGDFAVHLYRLPESVWPKEPDVGPPGSPPPSEENADAPREVPGDPDESASDE
jgi:WD40 repeat protein